MGNFSFALAALGVAALLSVGMNSRQTTVVEVGRLEGCYKEICLFHPESGETRQVIVNEQLLDGRYKVTSYNSAGRMTIVRAQRTTEQKLLGVVETIQILPNGRGRTATLAVLTDKSVEIAVSSCRSGDLLYGNGPERFCVKGA
jgi:hypothetical protein